MSAFGAGVALQTSTDNVNWTTKVVYVTRNGTDTNPMPASDFSGCSFAAGFPTATRLAPGAVTTCGSTPRFASANYSFTITVPAGTTTMYFRRLFFVAPRTSGTLCSVTTASDDVAVSDAMIVCS